MKNPYIIALLLFALIPNVYGVTVLEDTIFLSEKTGGYIVFNFNFTSYRIYTQNNQMRFFYFNESYLYTNLGFRCPVNATLNITSVQKNQVVLEPRIYDSNIDYEVFVGDLGEPSSVLNVGSWSFVDDTVYMVVNSNSTITLNWDGPNENTILGLNLSLILLLLVVIWYVLKERE